MLSRIQSPSYLCALSRVIRDGSMEMHKLDVDDDEYAYCDPCPSAKISCVMDGAMTPLREPLGPLPILSMASRNEVPLPSPPDKAKRRLRMLRVKDAGYRFRKVSILLPKRHKVVTRVLSRGISNYV